MENTTATIKDNTRIAKAIYRMVLHCPDVDLNDFAPGQFANVEITGHSELLLKRPFSINAVDVDAHMVTLIYQVVGKGTEAMSHTTCGTQVSVILPIGQGFDLGDNDKNVYLVGGGVGIAPLLSVIRHWPAKQYHAFLGYRGEDYAYCLGDFESLCAHVFVSSDDGTVGEHGFVTELVKREISSAPPDVVLACGPTPMLKALRDRLLPQKIRAQFSLEQRMACGFGACAACVCGIDKGDGLMYQKVCTDGPIFDMAEVVL